MHTYEYLGNFPSNYGAIMLWNINTERQLYETSVKQQIVINFGIDFILCIDFYTS